MVLTCLATPLNWRYVRNITAALGIAPHPKRILNSASPTPLYSAPVFSTPKPFTKHHATKYGTMTPGVCQKNPLATSVLLCSPSEVPSALRRATVVLEIVLTKDRAHGVF